MRTWERGSGMTLACGTGRLGRLRRRRAHGTDRAARLRAHLPGGDLDLEWSETDNQVRMTGPAVLVFSGEWPD